MPIFKNSISLSLNFFIKMFFNILILYILKKIVHSVNFYIKRVFVSNEIAFLIAIKQRLTSETDTVKSLGVLKTLSEKLEEKQWLEKNIETVWKAFDILKQYMQIGIKQR